jgi:hypothetical protein
VRPEAQGGATGAARRATAQDVRERLAALREAAEKLRRRPAEETLAALCRLFDAWSDAASPWRRRLEEELPAHAGFSRETVRAGLALALADWTGAALRGLVERELGAARLAGRAWPALAASGAGAWPAVSGFDTTAVVLAGSIPMPTLLSLALPLVLRSGVLAKSASRDRVTPALAARSLADVDAELGRCLELVDFAGDDAAATAALLEADCIVATGSDAAVASLRARADATRRVVCHGHRLSLAALGEAACAPSALADVCGKLALDVALWDQQGCLSPIAVYAPAGAADAVAAALAEALAETERRLPRGPASTAAAAAIAHERAAADLRGAGLWASGGSAWTVVRERDSAPRPAPLHRFVRVLPLADAAELRASLRPLARHLAAVALAGFGAESAALARGLAALGASRVCAPGRMQAPPLGWHHDGGELLTPLARFTDAEVAV